MKALDYLSKDEVKHFTQRSDLQGALAVFVNWVLIVAIFAGAMVWSHPVTWLMAIILLGGRQLGLAVLMHEAGHKSLFKTEALNEFIGQWLCAYPVLGDVNAYGASHRIHHRFVIIVRKNFVGVMMIVVSKRGLLLNGNKHCVRHGGTTWQGTMDVVCVSNC